MRRYVFHSGHTKVTRSVVLMGPAGAEYIFRLDQVAVVLADGHSVQDLEHQAHIWRHLSPVHIRLSSTSTGYCIGTFRTR
jgi:hypothetical protein